MKGTNSATVERKFRIQLPQMCATKALADENEKGGVVLLPLMELEPPVPDGNAVAYLLLHLGVPGNEYPTSDVHARAVAEAEKALQIKVREMPLVGKQKGWNLVRYVFRFPYYKRRDDRAAQVAEAVLYGVCVVSAPLIDVAQDPYILRIPKALISERSALVKEELLQLVGSRRDKGQIEGHTPDGICISASTASQTIANAWRLAPILDRNKCLMRAVRYLCDSEREFYVYPGEIPGLLADANWIPVTNPQQSLFESALLNAYKAIEAVIGEPPKNEQKLENRLRQFGLNPNERFGDLLPMSLLKTVRCAQHARDHKSAHGGIPLKHVTAGELWQYQTCARHIVVSAIEKELGSPIY